MKFSKQLESALIQANSALPIDDAKIGSLRELLSPLSDEELDTLQPDSVAKKIGGSAEVAQQVLDVVRRVRNEMVPLTKLQSLSDLDLLLIAALKEHQLETLADIRDRDGLGSR